MSMDQISSDSFFWSKNRVKTFTHWPFQDSKLPCNPEEMAAAGFVAVGGSNEPDLVECIFCFKQLDGWESSDDPWVEHARHQKTCPLIALNKKDERTWKIEELLSLNKQYNLERATRQKEKMKEALLKLFNQNKDNTLTTMKISFNKKKNL